MTSYVEYFTKVDIRRGIFQGDSLSPLLFVLCIVPLTQALRKVESGNTLKNRENFNHLLLIDDLKIFAKSDCEVYRLVSTVQMFNKHIGMEFRIKKCGVIVLKRGKVVLSEGVKMPDDEKIKDVEENDKVSMYFRTQQNQGEGDEAELLGRIFEKNEINNEKQIQW